jgi:arsenate reductase
VTSKYKVLFLCRENSARSIIAEALLRELAGHRFEVFSAGSDPAARVHALAIAQLRPGISDLGLLAPKSWLEFTGEWAPRMDLIVTPAERARSFEKVFWQIVRRVTLFMELPRYTSPAVSDATDAEPATRERDIVCPS